MSDQIEALKRQLEALKAENELLKQHQSPERSPTKDAFTFNDTSESKSRGDNLDDSSILDGLNDIDFEDEHPVSSNADNWLYTSPKSATKKKKKRGKSFLTSEDWLSSERARDHLFDLVVRLPKTEEDESFLEQSPLNHSWAGQRGRAASFTSSTGLSSGIPLSNSFTFAPPSADRVQGSPSSASSRSSLQLHPSQAHFTYSQHEEEEHRHHHHHLHHHHHRSSHPHHHSNNHSHHGQYDSTSSLGHSPLRPHSSDRASFSPGRAHHQAYPTSAPTSASSVTHRDRRHSDDANSNEDRDGDESYTHIPNPNRVRRGTERLDERAPTVAEQLRTIQQEHDKQQDPQQLLMRRPNEPAILEKRRRHMDHHKRTYL